MRFLILTLLLLCLSPVAVPAAPNPLSHPLVVKDAKGKLVGRLASAQTSQLEGFDDRTTVVRPIAGHPFALALNAAGFLDDFGPTLYYTTPDCTGQPSVLVAVPDLMVTSAVIAHGVLYYTTAAVPSTLVRSALTADYTYVCRTDLDVGFSVVPLGCCFRSEEAVDMDQMGPATVLPLTTLHLTPPFRLE